MCVCVVRVDRIWAWYMWYLSLMCVCCVSDMCLYACCVGLCARYVWCVCDVFMWGVYRWIVRMVWMGCAVCVWCMWCVSLACVWCVCVVWVCACYVLMVHMVCEFQVNLAHYCSHLSCAMTLVKFLYLSQAWFPHLKFGMSAVSLPHMLVLKINWDNAYKIPQCNIKHKVSTQ